MKAFSYKQLAAVALFSLLGSVSQAQVSLTATGGTSTGTFSTLNAAFAAINAGTHTGSIVISITNNTTEPSTPTPLEASGTGSASYTKIVIKPSGGNYTINSASSPSSYRGIIELKGADNVTIDGDDPSTAGNQNLTIEAATSTSYGIACVRFSSNSTSGTGGASDDTIRNCVIIGSLSSSTSTTTNYGIQFQNASSSNTTTQGAYGNHNIGIIKNTIKRCRYGIYAYGSSSLYPNTGLLIEGDTIGSSSASEIVWYGIYMYLTSSSSGTGAAVIRGNDIRVGGANGTSSSIAAIYLSSYNYYTEISGNNIHDVANPYGSYSGAYGIAVTSSLNTNVNIYNNIIRDITASNYANTPNTSYQNFGLYLSSGTLFKVNQNTFYLNAPNDTNSTATNEVSSCVWLGSSTTVSQMLNNIFVNNQGSHSSNAYCIISTGSSNLTSANLDNNCYYVNGSGNVAYSGTSAYGVLASWSTATGKDTNSVVELPAFTSSTDLHIPTGTSTQLESGGASATTTGVSKDIDGQTRPGPSGSTHGGASAPDIGADEFDGVKVLAPTVSGLTNSAVSCTGNVAHTITANVVSNSGTISSVTINYNNGSAGSATMTRISGTTSNGVWSGTIPAASAAGTTVTWSITAVSSIPISTTTVGTSYRDNPLSGVTVTATATPDSVCNGSSTVLKARAVRSGDVTIGLGQYTSQYGGTPFYHSYGGTKVQYIYTAAELHAAGLDSGNITSWGVDVTGTGTSYSGFEISMGSTTQSSFTSATAITAGISTVYSTTSYTPTLGINMINFLTPFYWNGTDNVVVSICWSNNNGGGTSTTVAIDYPYPYMTMYIYSDYQTSSTMCGATGGSGSIYASYTTTRPKTFFTGTMNEPISAYSWSNGTVTVGTTNPLITTPTASATYTATLTGANNCTINSPGVAVTLLPLPSAPTATNSTQCGVHVPTASVSGAPTGSTYKWYDTSVGGTLLQNGGSTFTGMVGVTTTFYVAIDNGECESIRTPVTVTVNYPDSIFASTTTAPFCKNAPIALSVTKAPGSHTYTYAWTASPTAGSGIATSLSGDSVSVTPTQLGTYTYTVTGTDGACVATSTVTGSVLMPPPPPTVTPDTPNAFCLGGSQALTATAGTRVFVADSFETFPLTKWTLSGTGVTLSQSTTYYRDGAGSAYMSYGTNSDASLTLVDSIDLTGSGNPVLSFYQICATEAYYDYGYIQYSTDNGATWSSFPTSAYMGSGTLKNGVISFDRTSYSAWSSQFTSSSATPGTGPATSLWQLERINLSAYTGSSHFKIRFRLTSDGSVNYYGWLIDSVAITSTPTVTFNWTSTPTDFTDTARNTVVTPTYGAPFTYTATVTATNGCKSSATTDTVDVHPLPAFSFNPANAAFCAGQSVTIVASGASTYAWSPSTGLNTTTGDTIIANPTSTTTYKVIGTTSFGCVDSINKTVTVNPLPTVSVTPSSDTICFNDNVILTVTGAANYVWSPAAGLSATTGGVVTASPALTTTYKVIGTDLNGCVDSTTASILVHALPIVSVTTPGGTTICGSGSLSLNASGAQSYAWTPGTGLSGTTGSSVIASPTTTTTYTVTGTDANGCSNVDSATVSVYALPVVSISPAGPVAVCNGFSTTLTASGANTYTWSPSSSLNSSTGSSVVATPTSTTTYTIVGTDIHGCIDSATKTVTVNMGPTVNISPATAVMCWGDSVVLTATGTASGYSWSPSSSLDTNAGSIVVARPSTTTTYTVIGLSTSGCGTLVQKVVTVNPLPNVTISPSTVSLCAGSSITLTASGASTYSWAPTTGLSAGSGPSVTASPATTTNYTVTGTDSNGCINTAQRNVVVHPLPTVSISPSANSVICFGQSVLMTASGATTYVWSPSTGLSSTSGASVSATPPTTTTYTLTGADVYGCTDTAQKTITVNPNPVVTVNPAAISICAGKNDSLHASGALTYSWSPSTGLSSATAANVRVIPTASRLYTVTGTDANGCTDTGTSFVTLLAVPHVTTYATNNSKLCPGDSVRLMAFGAATYVWSPSSSLSSPTGSVVTAYPVATTTYTVVGTATNGCTDTAQRTVSTYTLIDTAITPSGRQSICQFDSITLKAASGYASYVWMIYGVVINPATASSLTTGTGGFYTLTVSDSNGCVLTNSAPVIITVVQRPVPVIQVDGNSLDAGPGYLRYQWYLGDSAIAGATSQRYTPTASGSYIVEVTQDTVTNCPGKSAAFVFTATGIPGTNLAEAVKIFPNPSTDMVRIESPVAVEVMVTSMDGKLMFHGTDVKQFSVATWPDGVYQLRLRGPNGSFLKAEKLTKLTR